MAKRQKSTVKIVSNHLLETRFERIDHLPDDYGEYYAKYLGLLTAAEIFAELQHADAELMEGYYENRFGEMLKQMGFISIRTCKHRYYNVRLRPSDPSPDEDPAPEVCLVGKKRA